MFCSKCGEENPDESNFCKKCGATLNTSATKDGRLPQESATGLEPNVAGLLAYILGWITGLIFFLLEKDDQFVRFHAMQSIIVFGGITIIQIVLGVLRFVPYIGIVFLALFSIVWLGAIALWILLMIKAYQGERYKLPRVGDIAERYI
jgi:uncharacterized membrane protein